MLHISDIEKRLKDNPEPKEVEDIRNNIINSFSKLKFIEEGHKYFVENDDGSIIELPSVSHVCHQFQPHVDWDVICESKAKKLGLPTETLQRQWRENNLKSTNNGSKTHLFGEYLMSFVQGDFSKIKELPYQYEDGFVIPYGKKEEAIVSFYEDIIKINNIYPVMAESKIYTGLNDTLKLNQNYSGTFDMLFAFKNKKNEYELLIYDFKTNKELENQFNIDKGNMLLPPFNNYIDQSKSIYTIQLSAYQLGIEQLGYKVSDRKLIWLKDDGTYEKISLDDVTKTLKNTL